MTPIKPEGHADYGALRTEFAEILRTFPQERISEFIERFSKILEPFVLVGDTNERWRDEMHQLGREVALLPVVLGMEDPSLKKLKEGLDALDTYNEKETYREESFDRTEMRNPEELVDLLIEALAVFKKTAAAQPLDQWQLRKDTERIARITSHLPMALIRLNRNPETEDRAIAILQTLADTIDLFLMQNAVHEELTHELRQTEKHARGRVARIEERRPRKSAVTQ